MNPDVIEQALGLSVFSPCEIDPLRDASLMRRAHELRFQIYCLEQGFLDAIDYPDGFESDEHDFQSYHFASCGEDGEVAGYVRLVGPDEGGMFPFQNHCLTLHEGTRLPPSHQAAEISRLMVRACHRREPDRSPEILCGLFRQMYELSVRQDVRYLYAAMERSLVRVLQRMLRIEFQQIGPVTDYYGPVAPYLIDLREVESRLKIQRPDLFQNVRAPALCC